MTCVVLVTSPAAVLNAKDGDVGQQTAGLDRQSFVHVLHMKTATDTLCSHGKIVV
jgi:hypothetical protein